MQDPAARQPDPLIAFRREVRAFLDANLPSDMARRGRFAVHASREDYLGWARILAGKGWSVPGWPKAHGGPGWSARERQVFEEEALLAGAPPLHIQTVDLAGPLIARFGSEEQKDRHLAAIREGRRLWAQGFSEPGSGSDLASLRTSAVRDGDAYVINGQKIWTSEAYMADDIFCLVRTDFEVKPQRGLSILLFPLDLPGITIRPIDQIDGGHSLCEVFFDNVRVPADCLLGREGEGWTYAKALLAGERTKTAEVPRNKRELARLKQILSEMPARSGTLNDDQATRRRLARLEADLIALEAGVEDQLDREEDQSLPLPSVLKLQGTQLMQAILEFARESLGPYGALAYDIEAAGRGVAQPGPASAPGIAAEFLFRRAATIYGGTSQIQRNILATALEDLDPQAARRLPDDESRMLSDALDRFTARRYRFEDRKRYAGESADTRGAWEEVGAQGWVGADMPQTSGGFGMHAAQGAIVLEAAGRALMLEPILPVRAAAWTIIEADPDAGARLVQPALSGQSVLALAHEEPGSGAAAGSVATRARKSGNEYVLSGGKAMVLAAPQADVTVVSARTAGGTSDRQGVSLFAVPADAPGLRITPGRTLDGRWVGEVDLHEVTVREDALVGREGDGLNALQRGLDLALVDLCADTVGAMDGALWITRDYLRTREQFGQSLFEFQALRHKLADMFVELCRARMLLGRAVMALGLPADPERERVLAAARARIADSAFELAAGAVQLHGGIALTEEYMIGHYFKRICVNNSLLVGPAQQLDRLADRVAEHAGAGT